MNHSSPDPISEQNASSNKEIADLALEIAWNGYNNSMVDKRALDQKANMILVADGVLLGLVISTINVMELHLGLLSLGLITISGAVSLHALWFRKFQYLNARETWNQFILNNRLCNPPQAKIDTMATLDEATKKNQAQSENIVRSIKVAAVFLVASLFIIAMAVFAYYGSRFFVN